MRLVSVCDIPLILSFFPHPIPSTQKITPSSDYINPLLINTKNAWDWVETILNWFSKIFILVYGYSDMIIKHRQDGVNKKYKIEKTEKEAFRITNLEKRDDYDLDWFLELMDKIE